MSPKNYAEKYLENIEAENKARSILHELATAKRLLNKMLALHALSFDADVGAGAYPGAHHEEAEEALCSEIQAFLEAHP